MVNYPAPRYPGGTMLTVIRTGTANARDWQGDLVAAAETEHQIGPCDLKWLTDSEDNTSGEQQWSQTLAAKPQALLADTKELLLFSGNTAQALEVPQK